jgi:WD40 repeat protein
MRILVTVLIATAAFSLFAVADDPVSYYRQVRPLLQQNCNGCHRPGKAKGGLDLTTHSALLKGGKDGKMLKPGQPGDSRLVEEISGEEPSMPDEGEPLTAEEIHLIEQWIAQGAADDTPADSATHRLAAPPVYKEAPAVSAIAWSPDGQVLAVAGYHEVLLHNADGTEIVARLIGESPTITSVSFSSSGRLLAVAGGAASEYGEIQLWDVASRKLERSIRVTNDAVYGVAISPDEKRVAVGCADKTVRVFDVPDGRQVMSCDNHIDWVFGTAFSSDGTQIASASRDRALKLIDVASGHLIDDINRPREPLTCLARNPKEDTVVAGSDAGLIRMNKMAARGGRLAEGEDNENSFIRELPRLQGPVNSLAFSSDGALVAAAGNTQVRVFKSGDGNRLFEFAAPAPIFAVAFRPDGQALAIAGFDGKVRLLKVSDGKELAAFSAVPIAAATVQR